VEHGEDRYVYLSQCTTSSPCTQWWFSGYQTLDFCGNLRETVFLSIEIISLKLLKRAGNRDHDKKAKPSRREKVKTESVPPIPV
jgi:hypothetical protein